MGLNVSLLVVFSSLVLGCNGHEFHSREFKTVHRTARCKPVCSDPVHPESLADDSMCQPPHCPETWKVPSTLGVRENRVFCRCLATDIDLHDLAVFNLTGHANTPDPVVVICHSVPACRASYTER